MTVTTLKWLRHSACLKSFISWTDSYWAPAVYQTVSKADLKKKKKVLLLRNCEYWLGETNDQPKIVWYVTKWSVLRSKIKQGRERGRGRIGMWWQCSFALGGWGKPHCKGDFWLKTWKDGMGHQTSWGRTFQSEGTAGTKPWESMAGVYSWGGGVTPAWLEHRGEGRRCRLTVGPSRGLAFLRVKREPWKVLHVTDKIWFSCNRG